MRKILCIFISLIVVLLSVQCLAAEAGDFAVNQALALYAASEDGSSITIAENGISVNQRKITVNFSSDAFTANSSEVTVIAYKPSGNDATPTVENIFYINQLVYENNYITFSISPEAPVGTYVLLMGGSDLSAVARATFGIGVDATVVKGDVNNDSVFNTLDIIKLKNYMAKVENVTGLWTDRDSYAADFDEDGYVTLLDLAAMKESIANRAIS